MNIFSQTLPSYVSGSKLCVQFTDLDISANRHDTVYETLLVTRPHVVDTATAGLPRSTIVSGFDVTVGVGVLDVPTRLAK